MKKRILPILLALLMALSLFPASFADTGAEHEAELCEHEHEELAIAEETEAIEQTEPVEEPVTVEAVEIPEEPEEPEIAEPVELLDETDNDPGTCPHENTDETWYWVDDAVITDTGDNKTHEASGTRICYTYCEDCGVTLTEQEAEAYTESQNHRYNETGTCKDCGHICTHENVNADVEFKDESYTDINDNWVHEESYIEVIKVYCEDCRILVSKEEKPRTEKDTHEYDENGVCELCGHVNTCTHEHTVEIEYWDYDNCTITDLGDMHEVSGPYQRITFCEDCFQEIAVRSENRTGQEKHSYGDDGICMFCDHVNTCPHERFTEDWYWENDYLVTFTDTGDNLTHQASGVRTWYKECKDCGQSFDYRNEEYTGEDYHSYYGNDDEECYYCGHVNTCTHEHTYEKRYWKDETKNTYTDTGDNVQHEVSGIIRVLTICEDCGQSLAEGYREESYSVMKDHNYDENGKCEDCGHVRTYTITATATPAAGGTVTGAGTYETGANVTMKATAKSGYAFVNWTENGKEVSKSATYSFKAAADRKLTANFKKATPPAFDGTVELNKADVEFKGTTPYRVYNGKAQTPRVIVKDKSGKTVAASKYTVTYRDNTKPGTAYADVVMKDTGAKKTVWFKIYLPATTSTTVKNVGDGLFEDGTNGIQISWKKVEGAKGYVIYRRAWNLKSKGWTTFERWNNTTKTTWIDTKVYPGTRYQYGIKAYFDDPMDNYNLGLVGPLKTMVRITTRQFTKSGASGDNASRWTLTWTPSSLFTGYQIQIANDEAFTKNVKTVTINNPKTNQYRFTGLKKHIWYYTRVRSYHVFEGVTYYGEWSFPTGSLYGKER